MWRLWGVRTRARACARSDHVNVLVSRACFKSAGETPAALDCMYAAFSPALPSEWASSEMVVVEAVVNADSALETEAVLQGKIVLASLQFMAVESYRDVKKGDRLYIIQNQDELQRLVKSTRGASDWDSARHPHLCGKAGVATRVDSDNTLLLMVDGLGETPYIPVNACRQFRTGVTQLVERAEEAGASAIILASTDETFHQMTAPDEDAGYKSNIPALMIKSSDAVRLRERGSALIRDKGAPRSCSRDRYLLRAVRVAQGIPPSKVHDGGCPVRSLRYPCLCRFPS